jgi:hypothetical protein
MEARGLPCRYADRSGAVPGIFPALVGRDPAGVRSSGTFTGVRPCIDECSDAPDGRQEGETSLAPTGFRYCAYAALSVSLLERQGGGGRRPAGRASKTLQESLPTRPKNLDMVYHISHIRSNDVAKSRSVYSPELGFGPRGALTPRIMTEKVGLGPLRDQEFTLLRLQKRGRVYRRLGKDKKDEIRRNRI